MLKKLAGEVQLWRVAAAETEQKQTQSEPHGYASEK